MTHLIVGKDIMQIEREAVGFSKSFNPADVFWLKRQDGKTEIVVADIERFIAQAGLASVSGKKLFIVFEADTMNSAAQNKLLKTIEDAPDTTTVLFLAKTDSTILPTLKSRCVTTYKQSPVQIVDTAAADKVINAETLDEALPYLPGLTAEALTQSVKNSNLPHRKKYELYKVLSNIARNTAANCNPINALDLFLLRLFS
jgi:DNA polymerase III delta prime subunit